MKQFNKIFGKVMIEVSPTDVAMLGTSVPVVAVNDHHWVEFITWANKAFSPHLELEHAFKDGSRCCIIARITGVFNEKSVSALKASGFIEFSVSAEEDCCDDEGRPLYGSSLYLHIPYIPSI
jgi:hypothetical protein